MAESLKDIIAKLKQQNSQASTKQMVAKETQVAPTLPEIPPVDEDEEFEDDDEEEKPQVAKADPSKKLVEQIAMEIEMLQNNGRFRVELLHQLQEINQALVVIAGALANLSQYDKK